MGHDICGAIGRQVEFLAGVNEVWVRDDIAVEVIDLGPAGRGAQCILRDVAERIAFFDGIRSILWAGLRLAGSGFGFEGMEGVNRDPFTQFQFVIDIEAAARFGEQGVLNGAKEVDIPAIADIDERDGFGGFDQSADGVDVRLGGVGVWRVMAGLRGKEARNFDLGEFGALEYFGFTGTDQFVAGAECRDLKADMRGCNGKANGTEVQSSEVHGITSYCASQPWSIVHTGSARLDFSGDAATEGIGERFGIDGLGAMERVATDCDVVLDVGRHITCFVLGVIGL